MTGLADIQTMITPKRLEILRAAVPRATRFGVLWTPTAPSGRPFVQAAEDSGGKLGLQLLTVSVRTVAEFDGAFATMAQGRAGGVLVHGSALTARQNRELLAEVALKHRLPTMFGVRDNVVAGGLMSYGPDHLDLTRRAAVYIDKILKGARMLGISITGSWPAGGARSVIHAGSAGISTRSSGRSKPRRCSSTTHGTSSTCHGTWKSRSSHSCKGYASWAGRRGRTSPLNGAMRRKTRIGSMPWRPSWSSWVDDQLEFRGLLNRKIGGLGALEDLVHQITRRAGTGHSRSAHTP
jgi:ABC transporter substrate binding protein